MMQMQVGRTLVLALALLSCLGLDSGRAANVGRQRRVQTSATSTGPTQTALFGLPLWHTTFNSNDDQQAAEADRSGGAGGALELDYADLLPAAELTPAQMQQLLLLNTPVAAAQQMRYFNPSSRSSSQDEPRFFHMKYLRQQNTSSPSDGWRNITTVNINNNNVTNLLTTPAAAAAARIVGSGLLRAPQLLPMQYFQTRQGQDAAQELPYELIDLNAADLYGDDVAVSGVGLAGLGGLGGASAISGISSLAGLSGLGGLSSLGAGMPLVPITLGNNAVGYVPLNLGMFRQLAASTGAVPIREGEDDATLAIDKQEPEPESNDAIEEPANNSAQQINNSRFQLFGQRLRQRPGVAAVSTAAVNDGFPMRNPLRTFAKNIRRVQYL
ncbi:uncharacterized protein LOC115767824 [Drosophila novamexicana]|uniref:uncharacterized protein LOC115767824 n=1 Tax=Drosophila novamexicana TaxID=47314 RepID=UPI0011E5BFFF|nr:uncharacterized protein LOC115767824 [Drosophila novamexicana]